ncbi:MAG: hypothetical protein GY832_14460 [Chloroflexi bacterium]|nr:hypothetical protein [Chloroflexota bacterium]
MHHLCKPGEDGEGADWGASAAKAMSSSDRWFLWQSVAQGSSPGSARGESDARQGTAPLFQR